MTGAGMVLGTPEYMAPELIMGEPFDGRVDQYALAITVYEMLCGRRPFEDETKTKVLVLHTSKAAPRLTEWCPALPERLSQAVLKGLAKNPNDRYCALRRACQSRRGGGRGRRRPRRPRPIEVPGLRQDRLDPRGRLRQAQTGARARHLPGMQVADRHLECRWHNHHAEHTWWNDAVFFHGQFRRIQPAER